MAIQTNRRDLSQCESLAFKNHGWDALGGAGGIGDSDDFRP